MDRASRLSFDGASCGGRPSLSCAFRSHWQPTRRRAIAPIEQILDGIASIIDRAVGGKGIGRVGRTTGRTGRLRRSSNALGSNCDGENAGVSGNDRRVDGGSRLSFDRARPASSPGFAGTLGSDGQPARICLSPQSK